MDFCYTISNASEHSSEACSEEIFQIHINALIFKILHWNLGQQLYRLQAFRKCYKFYCETVRIKVLHATRWFSATNLKSARDHYFCTEEILYINVKSLFFNILHKNLGQQ